MGLWSFIKSVGSSIVNSAVSAGEKVYQAAKQAVSKTIEFLATKAEKVVETIKSTWARMKPYVEHFRSFVRGAAAVVPLPWLKSALLAVDQGLGAFFAFENSPIAKMVEKAIRWAIELGKRLHNPREEELEGEQEESHLSEAELHAAREHQANIHSAEEELKNSGVAHEISLLTAINDFEIAKADIAKIIKEGPSDFEHYLRLRATQKLLKMADKKFRTATDAKQISADDLFLVRVASDLAKSDPELTDTAALRLDDILQNRYNKKLTPFVFEEMIASWANRAEAEDQAWNKLHNLLTKDKILEKNLSISKNIQGQLASDEEIMLKQLSNDIPAKQRELAEIETKKMDIDRYVGASEGFLQLLEKEHEQIIEEGNEFLIDDSPVIGSILMRCAEQHIPFSDLSEEEQNLIRDYSNIFKKDSRTRMENILTVAV